MLDLAELITKTTKEGYIKFKKAKDLEEAKIKELKEFAWDKGLDELAKELDWGELAKIRKLILEIRYLQNKGDATKECDLEKEAGSHFKGLVGIGTIGTLDQKLITVLKEAKDLEEAKIKELKEFAWDKGLDELAKELDWGELAKIRKLILEIRYLQNKGDATKECDLEKEAGSHFKGLVGIGTIGTLDQKLIALGGKAKEEFYLVEYLRILSWDGNKEPDANLGISRVKNGEDDLLKGIDLEKRLGWYKIHLEGLKSRGIMPDDWGIEFYEAIVRELDKYAEETYQGWTNKLRAINGLNTISIDDAWKDKWTTLPNEQFDKIDKVESLIKETLGSDNKVDAKFIEVAKAKKASLTSLAEVMKEDSKEVIKLIERYKYNKLDDSASEEKDKKKTQQERRIKKALKDKDSNFDITKDLDDATLNDALYQIAVNELTINASKYYTADLKEITTKKPEKKHEEINKPFLRWDNPWVYAIGALAIGIVGVIIFWDKLVNLFSGDKEENN